MPEQGKDAGTRTLRDYLRVLRQNRGLVAATTVLAATAAIVNAAVHEPKYDATATVAFKEEAQDLQELGVQSGVPNLSPVQQATADARLVTRDDVVNSVTKTLGKGASAEKLRDQVSAEVQPTTNLVAITATDSDPEKAALIANTFAERVRSVVRTDSRQSYRRGAARLTDLLQKSTDPSEQVVIRGAVSRLLTLSTLADPVEINRPAEVPDSPVSPKPVRDGLVAAFIGFLIGTGGAFLRRSVRGSWTEPNQVERDLNLPLVGTVSDEALGVLTSSANGDSPFSQGDLEPFRIMKANVDFLAEGQPLRTIAVTSALSEEGKSTVAAWYAYANARAGRRTLLVECDFRRPVLAARLGINATPGLSEYIEQKDVSPEEILKPVAISGSHAVRALPVLPAGRIGTEPAEMIASQSFHHFIVEVASQYDLVVFDTAPLLPVGDTLELLPQVDGILLCLRLGQTTREQADAAKKKLSRLPAKPTGLVVTGIQRGSDDDYNNYYTRSPALMTAPE